ncbi:MAG TPA: hypothetical protein VGA00_06385 [Acidiferrobacterales bacterium]
MWTGRGHSRLGNQKPLTARSFKLNRLKALTFTANSLERSERGKNLLLTLLRDLVGPPLTKVQTPEQLMAEHETPQQPAGGRGWPADVSAPTRQRDLGICQARGL